MKKNKLDFGYDRTCALCGKEFMLPMDKNVYKLDLPHKRYNFCSYNCYCKAMKLWAEHPVPSEFDKAINELKTIDKRTKND